MKIIKYFIGLMVFICVASPSYAATKNCQQQKAALQSIEKKLVSDTDATEKTEKLFSQLKKDQNLYMEKCTQTKSPGEACNPFAMQMMQSQLFSTEQKLADQQVTLANRQKEIDELKTEILKKCQF
jgi:hypothetical protein